jgi:hypothetical protein
MTDQNCVKQERRRSFPYRSTVCIVIILFYWLVLHPAHKSMFQSARRTVCMSNLKTIGNCLETYVAKNKTMPSDIGQYVKSREGKVSNPTSSLLCCPETKVANYIFIPENVLGGPTMPIAYEPLTNHKELNVASVLFADYRVRSVKASEYDEVITRRKPTSTQPR